MFRLNRIVSAAVLGMATCVGAGARAADLFVGAATADITPDRPVPLTGMKTVRISQGIHSRCTANVLALESREGDRVVDQAILVSCDLCVIRPGIQDGFRRHVAARLPGFDIEKLFLAATHTHAAPEVLQNRYKESDYGDSMQPKEYVPFLYERMAEAVARAWESRQPGAVAWGLGHAVVGCNRRAVYSDGKAIMYGDTNSPAFRHIEGYEDHAVEGAVRRTGCQGRDGRARLWNHHFFGFVVDRYEAQRKADPVHPVDMHVLRIGDVAVATNPFELYVDYGVQIQARSPAPQTVLIQLAAPLDFSYYVPTPRAIPAGGYSAEITHNLVGPVGAQVLVDRTVEAIGSLWSSSK